MKYSNFLRLLIFVCLTIFFQLLSSDSFSQVLKLDSLGRISTFPSSTSFSKKDASIGISTDEFSKVFILALRDSLLRREDSMENVLKNPQYINYYDNLWGSKSDSNICAKLLEWKLYLNELIDVKNNINDKDIFPADIKDYFPSIPTLREWSNKAYEIISDSKLKKCDPLSGPLKFNDQDMGTWITGNVDHQVKFKFVFKNIFKETIADTYNNNLPTFLNSLKPSDYGNMSDSISVLLSQLKNKIGLINSISIQGGDLDIKYIGCESITESLLNNLQSILNSAKGLNEKAGKYVSLMDSIKTNKTFFIRWLWFNSGQLSLNPFEFTTSKNLYESIDSLKLENNNKASDDFQNTNSVLLYNFSFPYEMDNDHNYYSFQFNEAKNFQDVSNNSNNLQLSSKYLSRVNRDLPDNKVAFVVIHNIDSLSKLSINYSLKSIKDEPFWETVADTLTKGIAQFGSLKLSQFITPTNPQPDIIINPSSLMESEMKMTNEGEKSASKIVKYKSYEIDVNNKQYSVDVDTTNDNVVNDSILIRRILRDNDSNTKYGCIDGIIDKFLYKRDLNKYSKFNNIEKYNKLINDLTEQFFSFDQRIYSINKGIEQLAYNYNSLLKFNNICHLQIPPDSLKIRETFKNDSAIYSTQIFPLMTQSDKQDSFYITYKNKKSTDTTVSVRLKGVVNSAPRHWFTLGIGLAETINKVPLNSVSTSSTGQLQVSQDVQSLRLIVGVHFYLGKGLFNLDNRFIFHKSYGPSTTWSRVSLFIGTGIPDPLHNWYTGLSADLIPGLRIQAGTQWLWYTKYSLLNNQVSGQASGLRYGGIYFGLTIDPIAGITSLLTSL